MSERWGARFVDALIMAMRDGISPEKSRTQRLTLY